MNYQNILNKIEPFKIPLALSLIGLVLIAGGMLFSADNHRQPAKDFPQESLVSSKEIQVDVSGAVKTPGVYRLSSEARVEEAVAAAGGLSDNANQEYVSKSLNLAQKLSDGLKIYVPFKGETAVPPSGSVGQIAVSGASTGPVNLNTATQAQLEALPGIGPVTANKIISGRPYSGVDELVNKKVLSKSVFEKIKDQVVY